MNENKTRNHLANERTFLAWVRTAIALISFGGGIAKLRFLVVTGVPAATFDPHVGTRSTLLGLAFAATGVLTLLFVAFHYAHTRHAIESGDYQAAGRVIMVFALIVLLLGLGSLAYLFTLTSR